MVDNLEQDSAIFDIKELEKVVIPNEGITIVVYSRLEIAHNNNRYVFDVINDEGLKIGSFHFEYYSFVPFEVNLVHRWLEKEYRGRGYSKLVFNSAVNFLSQNGYNSIRLKVGQINVYG